MVSRPAALARGGQLGGRSYGLVRRSGVNRYQRTLVGVALVSLALAGCSGAEESAATAGNKRVSQGGTRDRTGRRAAQSS